MLGIGWACSQLPFNLVHFLLAWQYKTTSEKIPLILSDEPITKDSRCSKIVYWSLFCLNIFFPLFQGFTVVFYNATIHIKQVDPTVFGLLFFNLSINGTDLLQVISGVILVKSIIKIRAFYVRTNNTQSLNIKVLQIHATSYILYLIACFYNLLMLFIYSLNDTDRMYSLYQVSLVFGIFAIFVSDILLCAIFWDLGRPIPPELNETQS